MAGGSIFSKVCVEAVFFNFHSQFLHTSQQLVVVIFSLAAADNLPDSRNQTIHCCYCLVILIHLHIKGLNLFWIICNKYRSFIDFLCKISLMLCLKICSPGNLIFKIVIVLFQNLNSLCVSNSCKLRIYYIMKAIKKALVYKGIKEIHFLRGIFQDIINDIFQHILCQFHIII